MGSNYSVWGSFADVSLANLSTESLFTAGDAAAPASSLRPTRRVDYRPKKPSRAVNDLRKSPYSDYALQELYDLATSRKIQHCQHGMRRIWKDGQRLMIIRKLRMDDVRLEPYLKWTVADLKLFAQQKEVPTKGLKHKQDYIDALNDIDSKRIFRFLDLPPELRVKIYEYATANDEAEQVAVLAAPRQQPPLLHVCSFIRDEMLPTYFRNIRLPMTVSWVTNWAVMENNTECELSPATVSFLTNVDPANLKLLRYVKVAITTSLNTPQSMTWLFDLDITKPYSAQSQLLQGKEYGPRACLCGTCYGSRNVRLRAKSLKALATYFDVARDSALAGTLDANAVAILGLYTGHSIIEGGVAEAH